MKPSVTNGARVPQRVGVLAFENFASVLSNARCNSPELGGSDVKISSPAVHSSAT